MACERGERGIGDGIDTRVVRARDAVGVSEAAADEHPRQVRGGEVDVGVLHVLGQLDRVVLDRMVRQHHHHGRGPCRDATDVDRANRRHLDLGPDHDRGLAGQVRQQRGGVAQEILEPTVCGGEEPTNLCRLLRGEETIGADRVDEVPVPLVGGHTTRGCVGLDEIALLLERDHLVAHGGRGHPHRGQCRDVTRPDRLAGRDVLLHDLAQDRGLSLVEHGANFTCP